MTIRVDDDVETLYEMVGEGADLALVYREEADVRNAWAATVEALARFTGGDRAGC